MVLFDGNILISNDLTAFNEHCKRFSCEVRVVIVCLNGTISVIFRGEKQILKSNCMIYHSVKDISDIEITDKNSKALIMLYATEFAGSNITLYNNIWSIIHYVSKHPVIKLPQKSMQTLNHLFKLALCYMRDKENELHEGKMKNLLNLFLFEHMTIINQTEISDKDYHEVFSSNDYILKKFLTLVNQYEGKQRTVAFFARQMHITPKHLCFAVKQAGGKSPSNVIHEITIRIIKQQLQYTNRTINEISNSMQFPDSVTFAKFFKHYTSLSPTEFRKQLSLQIRK